MDANGNVGANQVQVTEFDNVELDMIRRGDMLGPKLGARVYAALTAAIGAGDHAQVADAHWPIDTDDQVKALVKSLWDRGRKWAVGDNFSENTAALCDQAADALESLLAQVAELTIQLRVVRLDRDGAVKRMEAAEKRLAEVEAERDHLKYNLSIVSDYLRPLIPEGQNPSQADSGFGIIGYMISERAHRDRLESAVRRQIQNIEHWLETGEPASPEESQSIYEQLKAALSGSSDPRKDVARRCVEIAQFHPNSVIGKLISEKIASEFSLDTKEGTDAGE